MAKFITICLWLLTFGCVALILYVKLGLGIPIYACENAESINDVLLNLSYSYLAGCIFYILTSYLPMYHKRKKMRVVIDAKIKQIYGILIDCKKSVLSEEEYSKGIDMSDETFKKLLAQKQLSFPCALSRAYNGLSIGQYLYNQKQQLQCIIDSLILYQDCMDVNELCTIAKLQNSDYFNMMKIILNPLVDNENIRTNVGILLLNEISSFKKIVS